jgi:hypothetical protein
VTFVDLAGGDYQLISGQAAVNGGLNLPWMDGALDLAGGPRILNVTVDMGAYESLFGRPGIVLIIR